MVHYLSVCTCVHVSTHACVASFLDCLPFLNIVQTEKLNTISMGFLLLLSLSVIDFKRKIINTAVCGLGRENILS